MHRVTRGAERQTGRNTTEVPTVNATARLFYLEEEACDAAIYRVDAIRPEWPLIAKVIAVFELGRGGHVIMAERLPTGELVLMTREVFEAHVQEERRRNITLEEVQRLIRTPDHIFEDGRPTPSARGKYFASRFKPDPYGNVKIKRLIAHLKRCRKLLIFEVSFVSTVLLAKRLPPQATQRWIREGLTQS
jgi:hypothetical protein